MNPTLCFTESIRAPRAQVWSTMLDAEGYAHWTAAFCEGSRFEGAWSEGAKIRFLDPNGNGMTAEIAESRAPEWLSIRHLGEIREGVDDTTSATVLAWAPAYETYRLGETPEGTELQVRVEVTPESEPFMARTFPEALRRLKTLCEGGA